MLVTLVLTLTRGPDTAAVSRSVLRGPGSHERSHGRSAHAEVHATSHAHADPEATHFHSILTFLGVEEQIKATLKKIENNFRDHNIKLPKKKFYTTAQRRICILCVCKKI